MNDTAFCPSRSACDAPHGWDPYPNLVGLAYLPGQKDAAAFRSRSSAPSRPPDTLTTSNVFDYALARHHNDRWRRRHRTWARHPHSVCVSHTKAVDPASHQGRDPALCYLVKVATSGGGS